MFQNLPAGKAIRTVLVDAESDTNDVRAYLTAQSVRRANVGQTESRRERSVRKLPVAGGRREP